MQNKEVIFKNMIKYETVAVKLFRTNNFKA